MKAVAIGEKYGKLTVLQNTRYVGKEGYVLCKCECGTVKEYKILPLMRLECGCGCGRLHNTNNKTHGQSGAPEYYVWRSILARCDNPKHKSYTDYGERGITYCDRWKTFSNFFEDMGSRPSELHQIDRENNEGNYCKENCRWVTSKVNCRNRRDNIFVEFEGMSMTLSEAAEKSGISFDTLHHRLGRGDDNSRLFRPLDSKRLRKEADTSGLLKPLGFKNFVVL